MISIYLSINLHFKVQRMKLDSQQMVGVPIMGIILSSLLSLLDQHESFTSCVSSSRNKVGKKKRSQNKNLFHQEFETEHLIIFIGTFCVLHRIPSIFIKQHHVIKRTNAGKRPKRSPTRAIIITKTMEEPEFSTLFTFFS